MALRLDEILKELELIPEDKTPFLLNLIRKFRESLKPSSRTNGEKTMLEIDAFAIDTGIENLAQNHDTYLYGIKDG